MELVFVLELNSCMNGENYYKNIRRHWVLLLSFEYVLRTGVNDSAQCIQCA